MQGEWPTPRVFSSFPRIMTIISSMISLLARPQSLLLKMHASYTLGQLTLLILLKYLALDLTLHYQMYIRTRSVIYFDLSVFYYCLNFVLLTFWFLLLNLLVLFTVTQYDQCFLIRPYCNTTIYMYIRAYVWLPNARRPNFCDQSVTTNSRRPEMHYTNMIMRDYKWFIRYEYLNCYYKHVSSIVIYWKANPRYCRIVVNSKFYRSVARLSTVAEN